MTRQENRQGCVKVHAQQALGVDSPVSSLYSKLRGRAAQAQCYAASQTTRFESIMSARER
jgi:hypothetical protein